MTKEPSIVSLTNLLTGEKYYFKSINPEKDVVSVRFKLDLNMFPCKNLQEDYKKTGLEAFQFDAVETVEITDLDSKLAYYLNKANQTKLYN